MGALDTHTLTPNRKYSFSESFGAFIHPPANIHKVADSSSNFVILRHNIQIILVTDNRNVPKESAEDKVRVLSSLSVGFFCAKISACRFSLSFFRLITLSSQTNTKQVNQAAEHFSFLSVITYV